MSFLVSHLPVLMSFFVSGLKAKQKTKNRKNIEKIFVFFGWWFRVWQGFTCDFFIDVILMDNYFTVDVKLMEFSKMQY